MNGFRFDTFVRGLPLGLSRRRLFAWTLVGVTSPATMAHFGLHDVEARKGTKKKVTLCRAGQTVTASKKTRKKLLREGATVGACQGSSPLPSPPSPPLCIPDCDNKGCGIDDCGGSCGTCGEGEVCESGQCRVVCPIDQVRCFDVCIPKSCQSLCNEPCRVINSGCCGPLTCKRDQTGSAACRP
jgi:hypothetical protein